MLSILKNDNSIGTMKVGDQIFKFYKLNDKGGKLLDMSNWIGTLLKINFIQEFLHDIFSDGTLDGVIIKRNLSKAKFDNFEKKYNSYKFEYEQNGGMVIIYQNLSNGIGHSFCNAALIPMFLSVNNFYIREVLLASCGISISLPNGARWQPDQSFLPYGRPSFVPTIVVEVGVSQSIRHLVNKCFSCFGNPQIEMVIGIKIFPKEADGSFKAVVFVFNRLGPLGNCQSIISFGNRRTTLEDENLFLEIANPQNTNILTGVLSTNQISNNTPNSPTFIINIPLATLLNGAVPQPQSLPNMEIVNNLPIDLFKVKSLLETIPINRSFTSTP
ncbi:hypothetical protein ACTFIZ_006911 [Dictyostelium cf. discoideum]